MPMTSFDCFECHDLAYGPGAAVQVKDLFAVDTVNECEGLQIKPFRRLHIGLKERKGADIEFKPAELFLVMIAAPEDPARLIDDGVSQTVIESPEYPHYLIVQFKIQDGLCKGLFVEAFFR